MLTPFLFSTSLHSTLISVVLFCFVFLVIQCAFHWGGLENVGERLFVETRAVSLWLKHWRKCLYAFQRPIIENPPSGRGGVESHKPFHTSWQDVDRLDCAISSNERLDWDYLAIWTHANELMLDDSLIS